MYAHKKHLSQRMALWRNKQNNNNLISALSRAMRREDWMHIPSWCSNYTRAGKQNLRGINARSREALLSKCILSAFGKAAYYKRSTFLPFIVGPFSEGALRAGNQTGSNEKLFPFYIMADHLSNVCVVALHIHYQMHIAVLHNHLHIL